jgi:hypothetical protein
MTTSLLHCRQQRGYNLGRKAGWERCRTNHVHFEGEGIPDIDESR